MLAATICAAPGSKARNKPPPTREQLVERCYDYRARLTNAQKGLDAQREQLVGLRKQVGSMQGELSDLEKQLEAEKSKRQELEREVFSLRRTKRLRTDPKESNETTSLRKRVRSALLMTHPDKIGQNTVFTANEVTCILNDLL
eukprot:6345550-Prymnesium_polylepis.1